MEKESWIEVEMRESTDLLRKRLERINATEPDEADCDTVHEIREIYQAMHYLVCVKKALGMEVTK